MLSRALCCAAMLLCRADCIPVQFLVYAAQLPCVDEKTGKCL